MPTTIDDVDALPDFSDSNSKAAAGSTSRKTG